MVEVERDFARAHARWSVENQVRWSIEGRRGRNERD